MTATDPPVASPARRRITFLTTVLTPRRGMENAVLRLATALAERHDVEILVLHDPGPVSVPRVTITCLDRGGDRRTRQALRRRLGAGRDRETLVMTGVWAAAQLLLAAPWRLPAAVAWEHSLTSARLGTGRRFRIRAEAVARAYRRCAAVVAVSPVVATTLRDRWSLGSRVIPNLLDLPDQSPGAARHAASDGAGRGDHGPVRLLALGETKPVKNYDALIRALPLLGGDWRLQMVGGGPLDGPLQDLARELGVADRITWHGDLANPTSVLAASDVLVHPSASETFGYVLFEAAEQWVPVVANAAPVMDSLVPQIVPGLTTSVDPTALAATVAAVVDRFSGPEAAGLFRAADQRRRQDFETAATLAAWEEVLDG